jgi:hypothetical protein
MSILGIISLMVEAVCTSETSVYYNEITRHNIPKAVIFILGFLNSPTNGRSAEPQNWLKYGNEWDD